MLARQSGLAAFDRLARDGASARVIPVNPTQTIPAHVAILTGADPQTSGIVANRIHLQGTPAAQETRTMSLDPDVESIVEAARRQGKRVGVVPFPTVDGTTPKRTADFGLVWSEPLVRGKVVKLTRADFKREWVPPTWTPPPSRRQSFSPVMRARLEWAVPQQARIDVDLVAYDRTDDSIENYDALFLESGGFESAPDARGWFPISIRTTAGLHGSWSKLLRADARLNDVAIYWGPITRNDAYPATYRELLDTEAGFWPGSPDESLDAQSFTEQLQRLTEFISKAQTATIRGMQFDLLLGYHGVIDQAAHPYLGKDDRVMRDAYLAANRALETVWQLLDRSRDALLVTGDHGLIATDREVRVNRLLADAGLAGRSFANGNVATIYGTTNADAVVTMLTATGYFERVEKKTATSHRHTGDVVAYALPAFAVTNSTEAPPVVPRVGGQHGALNTHRELHTVLFATGAGTPKGAVGEIAQTRIASFAMSLLGLKF